MFRIARIFHTVFCLATATMVMLIALAVILTQSVQAQQYTYTKLHDFTGMQDGGWPVGGVTMDAAGNLYGTAGSSGGYGLVYKLTPHKNGNWTFAPLYMFTGADGAEPNSRVVIGPNGTLYGTTLVGGSSGIGAVFNLKPTPTAPRTALTPWVETVLHSFQGSPDGANPGAGAFVFDASGSMYNTTVSGGDDQGGCPAGGCGTVYKLTPAGQGYTESVLYRFTGGSDGAFPPGSAALDQAGNLYTTTSKGGTDGYGTVIQLTPSGSGWIENTIHKFSFSTDGAHPASGVILDNSGNLYGTTSAGGQNQGGTVFELIPSAGSWTFKLLYALPGMGLGSPGPEGNLVMDGAGNLYGTMTYGGAYSSGLVFKLTPAGDGWTYIPLYDFCKGGPPCSDGEDPICDLIMDASGNLYGTAFFGGAYGAGVVFELTP